MSLHLIVRRGMAPAVVGVAALAISACSSGNSYIDNSDYVSPIAVSSAPQPSVPVASGVSASNRRLPLLPPVPEEHGATGLPPVNMAGLMPPPVR